MFVKFVLCLCLAYCAAVQGKMSNPYRTLGISKSATADQISKAYRSQAMLWHPDQNRAADAEDKFSDIRKAYELLHDKGRKDKYDRYGITDDTPQPTQQRRNNFRSNPGSWGNNYQQKMRYYNINPSFSDLDAVKLTAANYDGLTTSRGGNSAQPFRLWLVYVFGDSCSACETVKPHFNKAQENLAGIAKMGGIYSDFEQKLVRHLGVRTVPHFYALLTLPDGTTEKFQYTSVQGGKSRDANHNSLTEFVGKVLARVEPLTILTKGSSKHTWKSVQNSVNRFLGKKDSRVEVLIVSTRSKPHVMFRYLAARYKKDFRFAYICVDSIRTANAEGEKIAVSFLGEQTVQYFVENPDSKSPVLVFKREANTPDTYILSGISSNVDQTVALLESQRYQYLPEMHGDNYYELCYKSFKGQSKAKQKQQQYCLMYLAETEAVAQTHGLKLLTVDGVLPALLTGQAPPQQNAEDKRQTVLLNRAGQLQMGWVNTYTQSSFADYFTRTVAAAQGLTSQDQKKGVPTVVLTDARNSEALVFPGDASDAAAVSQWVQECLEGKRELLNLLKHPKLKRSNGPPYLQDAAKSGIGFGGADAGALLDLITDNFQGVFMILILFVITNVMLSGTA